jgi:hypothetical protein
MENIKLSAALVCKEIWFLRLFLGNVGFPSGLFDPFHAKLPDSPVLGCTSFFDTRLLAGTCPCGRVC